jgi:hypothetical protein
LSRPRLVSQRQKERRWQHERDRSLKYLQLVVAEKRTWLLAVEAEPVRVLLAIWRIETSAALHDLLVRHTFRVD